VLSSSNFGLVAGGLGLVLVAVSGNAALAQQTQNLTVTAQVQASCVLNGGTLPFGVYTGQENDATGQFSCQCTGGTDINLTLGLGQNPQGAQRAMVVDGGGDTLAYELYSDSNRQTVWDDSVGVDINGVSAAQEFAQVYGRILAGEDAPAGNYSDTVLITLVVE
jgi:spore coat protein U-like protein